ncbi:MAG: site-specific integrase, partial [Oscillospiraceae bacterium]|nr:site-specific integrase [Oscillospiraceae bacterium]
MTVASQIEDFRRYLIEDRRAPSNTVISYMRDLSRFSDFLVGSGIDEGNGVTPSVVSAYVDKLKNDGWSASTVSRSVAALKCFYSYLHQAGHMPANPAANASAAPPAKSLPRILTIGEMELLLKQPLSYGSKGCRDKAMLDLMYATGIRVSEFVALNIDDINLATGLVRCRDADKHKERHIPLYPSAIKSL